MRISDWSSDVCSSDLADCVRAFDRFRAPPSETALARRRAAGLSARQEANLQAWGYPYVMEDFRLHFTLTGRITDPAQPDILRRPLEQEIGRASCKERECQHV